MITTRMRAFLHALSIGFGLSLSLACFTAAHATTVTLNNLLGTTVDIEGVNFTFDSYSGSAVPAANVNVTYPPSCSTAPGFTLTASFGALAGASQDASLVYTVTGPGPVINDLEAVGNPTSSGSGSGVGTASASATLHSGTSTMGPILGNVSISSATTVGPVTVKFVPSSTITVVEDIEAIGGTGGVQMSFVTNTLSEVPLPAALPLFATGLGALGLLGWRRKRKSRLSLSGAA